MQPDTPNCAKYSKILQANVPRTLSLLEVSLRKQKQCAQKKCAGRTWFVDESVRAVRKRHFGFQSFAQSRLWGNVTLVFKVSHNRGCEKTLPWFSKFRTIAAVRKRHFGFQSFAQSRP
jgi:hypothetical protein